MKLIIFLLVGCGLGLSEQDESSSLDKNGTSLNSTLFHSDSNTGNDEYYNMNAYGFNKHAEDQVEDKSEYPKSNKESIDVSQIGEKLEIVSTREDLDTTSSVKEQRIVEKPSLENTEEDSTKENPEETSTEKNPEETSTEKNPEETSTEKNPEETSTEENPEEISDSGNPEPDSDDTGPTQESEFPADADIKWSGETPSPICAEEADCYQPPGAPDHSSYPDRPTDCRPSMDKAILSYQLWKKAFGPPNCFEHCPYIKERGPDGHLIERDS